VSYLHRDKSGSATENLSLLLDIADVNNRLPLRCKTLIELPHAATTT